LSWRCPVSFMERLRDARTARIHWENPKRTATSPRRIRRAARQVGNAARSYRNIPKHYDSVAFPPALTKRPSSSERTIHRENPKRSVVLNGQPSLRFAHRLFWGEDIGFSRSDLHFRDEYLGITRRIGIGTDRIAGHPSDQCPWKREYFGFFLCIISTS